TIQQLLDHRAGLETYHDAAGDFQPMTRDEALTIILNTPLIGSPGASESYSNSGYTLLAILIEKVSGIGYQDYVHQHVIDPLGLTSTRFWGEDIDPIASTRNRSNGYGNASQWDYSWVLVGNGGMVSTTHDLLTFARGMAAGAIFDGKLAGLDAVDGEILAAGGGDATDYVGVLIYDSESDSALIHLTNQLTYDAESVSIRIYFAIQGEEELPLPPETLPVDGEQLEPLSSVYSESDGSTINVEATENGLLVGAAGQSAVNLLTGQSDPQLDAINTQTEAIIEAAAAGDYSLLADGVGSGSEAELAGLWNNLVTQNGIYESVTILGATFNRFEEIDVLFRLNFADGKQYIRWTWADDEIVNFEFLADAESTIEYLYLPVNSGFATFSLDNPDMPILHFGDDDTLTIGDVVLSKK
ncbi:MAG: beta-lactamase family protein, partial [Chloroflexi bacterium]|nr:beta-lactamase family protein [Chloroflexota bacterium]